MPQDSKQSPVYLFEMAVRLTLSRGFGTILSTMLMIRLQRVGRKHDPSYRVVVTEKTSGPKSGNNVEVVGSYDARQDRSDTNPQLNKERILHWISKGAQTSGTVHNLIVDAGIIKGDKQNVLPKRKPVEETEEEKKEEAPAEGGETPAEGGDETAPAEEAPAEETPAEEPKEEVPTEEEKPAEGSESEDKKEEPAEEKKEE